MSNICFVFPNKRSGTFFLKELSDNLGDRTILAPEVLDISEFVKRISGLETAPRIDLLFRLYKIYCSLQGRSADLDTESAALDFDQFVPWGEIVINDFDEVEKYDVQPAKLFYNLRDYRNIASNFLTDEQLEIIERYFGYRPSWADVEGFWKSVDEGEPSELRKRFVKLWRLLPELFEGLTAGLEADGMAMEGTAFRRAMLKIENEDYSGLPWDRVVFVGFNMLSTTEARIFRALSKLEGDDGEPYAEFFWDAPGPVLGSLEKNISVAAKAIRLNLNNFPMPGWALPFVSKSQVDHITPRINILAAPSNSVQTKIAGEIIKQMLPAENQEKKEEKADSDPNDNNPKGVDIKTAIVVPDENLLMPLLHSLPEELDSVNLTMGYPVRFTSVASFIYHLRRLQLRRRKVGDSAGFLYVDLLVFLAHPLVHALVGTTVANKISSEITRKHMRVLTPEWLGKSSGVLAEILAPLPAGATVEDAVNYLDRVFDKIVLALGREKEGLKTLNSKLERDQIEVYRRALMQVLDSVRRHNIAMGFHTMFHLVDRLIAGEKVQFKGEPLEGLQVMGVLETRALDFERLVILSMNDKVMPRAARRRTFVPDSLRRGYGLPLSSRAEELYAYYFYRLISRADEVNLIYDARAGEGMRSGGKSRFLMQLEMLYAPEAVKTQNYTFVLNSTDKTPEKIDKTPDVLAKLENFRIKGSDYNLSASALTNYCQCQLRFYYQNVMKIGDDPTPSDSIDALTQGNIVHEAMLNLYFPVTDVQNKYLMTTKEGLIVLKPDDLRAMLNDKSRIEREVRRAVNKKHFKLDEERDGAGCLDRPLSGKVEMVAERLGHQIRDVIRHDLSIAPITLVGGEINEKIQVDFGRAGSINISYAFDRVDMPADSSNIRIIDYKSGGAHVEALTFDDVFNGNYQSKQLLQLLFYACLLEKRKENVPQFEDIEMLIYDSNNNLRLSVTPKVGKYTVSGYADFNSNFNFEERLEELLCEIFDPGKPFMPPADEGTCTYCRMKPFCGKE